jgi:hypothetical protein
MPTTWIEDFLEQVKAIDLTKKCPTEKRMDKDETVLGELSEYLQKLYRLREQRRENAEMFRDQIEDIKEVHATEHRLGISTRAKCTQHMQKVKDLFDQFKAVFLPYITIDHLLTNELEKAFEIEMTQFAVTGIREGKLLVGRNDNSRSDEDCLDEFFLQTNLLLELERSIKNC